MRLLTGRPRFMSPYRQQLLLRLRSPARRSVGAPHGGGARGVCRGRQTGAYTRPLLSSTQALFVGCGSTEFQ
jgi:hypothetical protein